MTTSATSHQPSCAAFWVRAIAEALESEGLDLPSLFAEAGLELAALKDPYARFASDKVCVLWQLAVARSGNPTLGLTTSQIAKPASFAVPRLLKFSQTVEPSASAKPTPVIFARKSFLRLLISLNRYSSAKPSMTFPNSGPRG